MERRISIGLLIVVMYTSQCNAIRCPVCLPQKCDNVIEYAMETKQYESIKDRLDDFIGIIDANTRQTLSQTGIIEQEVLAYRRLRERIKHESFLLQKASHLSKKIKNNSILEKEIHIINKGK